MRRLFTTIGVVILTVLLVMPAFRGLSFAEGRWNGSHGVDFWLTVLHNNDGESQLIDAGSGLEDFGGVARFARLLKKLRFKAKNGFRTGHMHWGSKRGAITLSSGDNFLASPEFNASLEKGVPFYDSIALDLIRYDAMCLGNHEFDFGPDVLADFIEGFRGRVRFLSANLDFSLEPRLQSLVDGRRVAKSTIVRERGERIGVVGATTEELSFISSPRDVLINEVLPSVKAEIDKLEAMGVDKIILISHLQSVDEDLELIAKLTGVDIAIAGGGDEILANEGDLLVPGDEERIFGPYPLWAVDAEGHPVPVVTTGGSYKYVGRLVAGFDRHGDLIMIDEDRSGPVRVAGGDNPDAVPPAPLVQIFVVRPVEEAVAGLADNVIGTSEVALEGRREMVRTVETNEGNLIADALRWQAEQLAGEFGAPAPDVALQNGGGIRNDSIIGPGDITKLDTFDMLPFPSFVTIVPHIPRDQFKEILENAVSRVESVSGRFAQISGFSMVWNSAGTSQELNDDGDVVTPGTRVVDVALDDGTDIVSGGAVVAGADLNIATIDFLARGGDQYPYRGAPFISLGVSYQQALRDYIVEALTGVIGAADYPEGGEGRITNP